MLLVKTYLDKSPIAGIGLFAAEPISAGEELTCDYGNFDDSKKHLDYCRPKEA